MTCRTLRTCRALQRQLPASRRAAALIATALLLTLAPAAPLPAQLAEKASVELVADRSSYSVGGKVQLAALVTIEHGWHVNSHAPTEDWLIPTVLSLEIPGGASQPEIRYPAHEMLQFDFAEAPIAVYEGLIQIHALFDLPADLPAGPLAIAAGLEYQACDDKSCLPPVITSSHLELTIGGEGEAVNVAIFNPGGQGPTATASSSAAGSSHSAANEANLGWMLLLAVIGGLILNAMPCVLPVLSLKVFGLVQAAGAGRRHVVQGGLATSAGILVSFWALGLAAIVAARAGAAVGWGVQFQEPGFVALLTVVIVLFSLNMWGLFEISLPMALAKAGGGAAREGIAGHFVSGLFATLMATPCSAPFLGTAIGFALVQPAPLVMLMFTAIGVGLALPYLLIAAFPGSAKLLPKPGAWMVTFKHVMGFLLAAAAVWLFYVLAAQISPESVAYVQLLILALALAIWLAATGRDQPKRRRIATISALLVALATVAVAATAPPASRTGDASARHDWVAFDEAEAERLAEAGRPVFVDFTADWCMTCKAIERTVLETDAIEQAFATYDVVPMKGDWTSRDDRITEYLARHGRAAVPFFVLYRPGQEPLAFGEVITQSGVIEALESSAERVAGAGGAR